MTSFSKLFFGSLKTTKEASGRKRCWCPQCALEAFLHCAAFDSKKKKGKNQIKGK